MTPDILQGFLDALHTYSNHDFVFKKMEPDKILHVSKETTHTISKEILKLNFQLWLFNSTADFFYDIKEVNYSPILNTDYWKSLNKFHMQQSFIISKTDQFFDMLETDLFLTQPYVIYNYPFGQAVICDPYAIECNGEWYLFSLGWDD